MISLVRVDDRLIHGQITVGWVPYLQASRVIVVNDRLAVDPVLTAIVKAGGTTEIRIDVQGVAEAVSRFEAGEFEPGRVIVLFESLGDARKALQAGMRFSVLNLGGIRGGRGGHRVGDAVSLSGDDLDDLRELQKRGVAVEVRLMPGDRPGSLPQEESRR